MHMSAHGDQMEREYSARSLSGGEGSEVESQFPMESVIYMSSFAATVFIAALVSLGVLLMMLLISLTVMLQSCESRSAGIVEKLKSNRHDYDYDYCKIHALHAEINSFEVYSLPKSCKDVAVKYIKEGHYMRDLNTTESLVDNYFNNVMPVAGGRDVVVMDIDDLLPSVPLHAKPSLHRFDHYGCHDCVKEATHLKHIFLLQIYIKLRAGGWPLILLSRKPEKLRASTLESLMAAGCGGFSNLIMRSDEEMKMDTHDFFSRQKVAMQSEGYYIRAVISSHMDALSGPFIGTQVFKLPNPIYHTTTERYTESISST